MKYFIFLLLSLCAINGYADENNGADDWRNSANAEEQLEKVIKVIPSTSDIMFQMGHRYRNLYWAAKQGKWEFAEYQIEEMESLIKTLIISRPVRAETANKFLERAFVDYEDAIESKDWPRFQKAFDKMRRSCERCHQQNRHGFIKLQKSPTKGHSPALD